MYYTMQLIYAFVFAYAKSRFSYEADLIMNIPPCKKGFSTTRLNFYRSNRCFLYEPHFEKTGFLAYAKTKTQISCTATAQLISAFDFATQIVQSLCFLNPKFLVSSHLLWLYSRVCVRPGRKPRKPFSHNEAHILLVLVK